MRKKKRINPFYILLVLVGIAFCITATAFGVLTLRDMRAMTAPAEETASAERFMRFVEDHAVTYMIVELVLLAAATVGAIATDSFWSGEQEDGKKVEG